MAPVPEKPDAELRTSNGSIDSSLGLIGTRLASIVATTSNGSIRLRAQRQGPVSIDAESRNGAVHLWLPRGFQGIVTAHSSNGSVKLSPALMESAVLVPHEGAGQAWRVRAPEGPRGGNGGGGDNGGSGGGGDGPRRKGVRAHAQIDIEFKFGSGGSKTSPTAVPAPPSLPVPPTPPAPAVEVPHPPTPPQPHVSFQTAQTSTSGSTPIPNPFTPTDDKKSLALAYATADNSSQQSRLDADPGDEPVPVHAQWERQAGEMGEERPGPDSANVRTSNGSVRIYLADEFEQECASKCLLM